MGPLTSRFPGDVPAPSFLAGLRGDFPGPHLVPLNLSHRSVGGECFSCRLWLLGNSEALGDSSW